jgi:hypothetical protein
MFVVLIEGVDSSSHTLEIDAQVQKQRFEDNGATTVTIEEKDTFEPVQ